MSSYTTPTNQHCEQCGGELDAAHLWSGICFGQRPAGLRPTLRVVTAPQEVRLRLVLPAVA